MKNILIITTKLSNGGAEKVVTNLADKLQEKYNVIIAVFNNKNQDYFCDAKIIDLKTKQTNNIIKKIYNLIVRFNKIKEIKKKYKIDCSISFLTETNLINSLTKKKEKIIVSIRNNLSEKKFKNILKFITKITFKKADKIVVVSKHMEEDIKQKYLINNNKITTIYNGCNQNQIEKLSNEKIEGKYLEMFTSGKTIITMGRFNNQKAHWHLIRSFSNVVKEVPDAKLLLLGRGHLKKYLQNLIIDLKLEKNIKILEFQRNPYNFLKKCDIFIMPSLYEGMSNSIIEAMCCNLPVIATDCKYGNREILSKDWQKCGKINKMEKVDYGVLIPTCDGIKYNANKALTKEEIEMTKAILYVLKNKEKFVKCSIERKKDFKLEDRIKEWIEVIER